MASALEMVMSENRSPYDRKIRIGAHEVEGESVDEVEQALYVGCLDRHRTMGIAQHDAMLFEISVRGILEPPRLPSQFNRAESESRLCRMLRRSGPRLVLLAEIALRSFRIRYGLGRICDIPRILLGLGCVHCYLEVAIACGHSPMGIVL